MASGSSASLPSLHSSISPSPSASSSTTTTVDSDASLGNVPVAPLVREVRFDERCILIPERPLSRPPRLATGTFEVNLPFKWPALGSPSKEKHFPTDSIENDENAAFGAGLSTSPPRGRANHSNHETGQHVVLKLPYPVFRRKSSSSSRYSVAPPPPCLRHPTSPPSSAKSATFGLRDVSLDSGADRRSISGPGKPKRRSASLSALPLDPSIETIPLRPCCEKCLAASETHWNRRPLRKAELLPTLRESSREHTPSQSRLDLREDEVDEEDEDDWCAGLHFTKGALKLWRSASVDRAGTMPGRPHALRQFQEGPSGSASGKLLDSLVRVDEIDRKHGSSPSASMTALAAEAETDTPVKSSLSITVPDLERVKRINRFDPPSPTGSGTDESEEDLFPLPSPKHLSPAASPSDSVTCLPAQTAGVGFEKPPPADPRQFEAAIRLKMAENAEEVGRARTKTQAAASAAAAPSTSVASSNPFRSPRVTASAPIPIPGAHLTDGVSHFHSNLEEIPWDPSLPDPDALPPNSTILLNSPPGSPVFGPSINEGNKHTHQVSPSLPSLPPIRIPRAHIPDVHLPLSPKKRGSGSGSSNPTSPTPASTSASASVPGIYTSSSPPLTRSPPPVSPTSTSTSFPTMQKLTQSRSNTEDRRTSPPSPQTPRRHGSVGGIVRALRSLAPTSSVSMGSEAAGFSRGVII